MKRPGPQRPELDAVRTQDDMNRDLGFGSRVAEQTRRRYLNRDGSFNVVRTGFPFLRSHNLYHWLLSMSWGRYFAIVSLGYFLTNLLFAVAYVLCGPGALQGIQPITPVQAFLDAFFFSVQTLATIGYGRVSPIGFAANMLVAVEALFGLLGFALVTGLLFARFSRPDAKIIYSDRAVIAPYRGGTAFQFRIVNERNNQLIEVAATVTLSRNETAEGKTVRKFYPLPLERSSVVFMPLHWVVVHPIDASSPLYGVTKEAFDASDAEILVLITGIDEIFSATVHSRSSYKYHEVVWGVRFADIFLPSEDGEMRIDIRRIHDIEPARS